MSCNFHVRQALLKAAAKKRFKNILTMKAIFKWYLHEEEEEEEYCWCGEVEYLCDHCGDCERFSTITEYIFCPTCGVEM